MNRVFQPGMSKGVLFSLSLGLAVLQATLFGAASAQAANRIVAWGDINYDVVTSSGASVSQGPAVAQISAGNYHSVALGGDGSILVWGDNRFGQTSVPQLL